MLASLKNPGNKGAGKASKLGRGVANFLLMSLRNLSKQVKELAARITADPFRANNLPTEDVDVEMADDEADQGE